MDAIKQRCPICSKTLSYRYGFFSKHGYQIRYHQHTPSLCFGANMPIEGLVKKYIEAMEGWLETEKRNFPNEWLELAVTSSKHQNDKEKYLSFLAARQLIRDIAYFRKILQKEGDK